MKYKIIILLLILVSALGIIQNKDRIFSQVNSNPEVGFNSASNVIVSTSTKTYKLNFIKASGSLNDRSTYYPGGPSDSGPTPRFFKGYYIQTQPTSYEGSYKYKGTFSEGTEVSIDFLASKGMGGGRETKDYEIVWSTTECKANANPCTIKMDSDKTITFLIRKKPLCDADDFETIEELQDSISGLEKSNKELEEKIKKLKDLKKKELLKKYKALKEKNDKLIEEYKKALKELQELCSQ